MPVSTLLKDPLTSDDTPYVLAAPHAFHLSKTRPQNAMLLPSPRMIRSSSKENAPTTATVTRKKKPLPSASSAKSRPSLGRRVVFSPTPLPSLQASPKHKRTFSEHLEECSSPGGGGARPAKRVRRIGVYSNHPFLGLMSDRDGSSSPEEEDEMASSPPTTPEEFAESPARTRGGGYFKLPFTLPGLTSPKLARIQAAKTTRPQVRVNRDDDDVEEEDDDDETDTATDSETESNFVSSLLLHRLPSSSSSISSSSPIRSPCINIYSQPRRSSSSASTSWLKGILKPVVGGLPAAKAANEKEGTRRNGRGRKHVIGWDDMRVIEATDANEAGVTAGKGKSRVRDTSEGIAPEAGNLERPERLPNSKADSKKGDDEGDDDEEKRKKNRAAGGQGNAAGSGSEQGNASTSRRVPRDDPWLLRTPLLVLKASLRPVSASHIRPSTSSASDFAVPLEPRASPVTKSDAEMLVDEEDEGEEFTNLFETPTFLVDVESAYVDLTQAIFQLPATLSSQSTTLEPLHSFRKTFVKSLARDIENIISFPSWVKSSNARSSPPPSSGSSAPSSPIFTSGATSPASAGRTGKKSLTEEQMRRLRDEIGVAQAGLRCATAVMRDERIYSIFTTQELATLLRLFTSLPTSPGLNILVQRDLFPFVPFLLHDQTLPVGVLAPLIKSHVLPSFATLLSLPHRADRHRISFGETLAAITVLLATHSEDMLRDENWRTWFRGSMLGLWDGPKKGVTVKGRSLKVAGRLVRCLTSPIEWTEHGLEWVKEREEISRQVGEEMLALLNEVPDDLLQARKPEMSRLQGLTQQWTQITKAKTDGNTNVDEANLLYHVSLLSILPALLGPSFRKLEEKGITPWIKPFNQLHQSQTSVHILATLALAWTNLGYAFCRSTSASEDGEVSWILRKRGNDNKALSVLSNIFRTRHEVWTRADGTPTKKERKRSHAKALSISYAASLHGMTVSIHRGASSVRALAPELEPLPSLKPDQLEQFDEVFERLIVSTLPCLTRSPFVETARIGWDLLASILRSRSPADRFAVLEDIVNPAILEVQLASAKTSEYLDLVLANVLSKAFDTSKLTGWGSDWVQSRVERVLALFETCATSSRMLFAENVAIPVWNNLLEAIAVDEAALSKAIDWLANLESTSLPFAPDFVRDLWTTTMMRKHERLEAVVTSTLENSIGGFQLSSAIFRAWQRIEHKPAYVAIALARGWTRTAFENNSETSKDQVGSVISLLRYFINIESLSSQPEAFEALAASFSTQIWRGDRADLEEEVRKLLRPPTDSETSLQLCTLFLSTSHALPPSTQTAIVGLAGSAVQDVLGGDTVRSEIIPLIADMLAAASDDTYSALYEAVLDSLATIHTSSDSLAKFVPLLTPSLDRALDFHAGAVVDDGSQFETFAARPHLRASLQPLLAFNKFWRTTYAHASLDIVYPPELVSRLHLVKGLAQDVLETQPQESSLYSQLEESVRAFASIEEQARAQTSNSTHPTLGVSTRDYDADLDQSRFHPPTGDVASEDGDDDTSVAVTVPHAPSISLRGSADERAGSVIQETPREVLIANSKASYASLASSGAHSNYEAEVPHESLPIEETLGDVKKRGRKRQRVSEVESPVIIPSSSEDDDVIIVRSSQSSTSSIKPPRKKSKNASKKRGTKSASIEDRPIVSSRTEATKAAVDDKSGPSSTRPRRAKAKARATAAATSSPASSTGSAANKSSDSTDQSPRDSRKRTQDEEAIRRVLALPLETVAHVGKLIGGTASLHRLMAIGEAANDYFEKLKR
ncbi:hypothetical protein JCM11491_001941 [Sporobolomyces phaffii]